MWPNCCWVGQILSRQSLACGTWGGFAHGATMANRDIAATCLVSRQFSHSLSRWSLVCIHPSHHHSEKENLRCFCHPLPVKQGEIVGRQMSRTIVTMLRHWEPHSHCQSKKKEELWKTRLCVWLFCWQWHLLQKCSIHRSNDCISLLANWKWLHHFLLCFSMQHCWIKIHQGGLPQMWQTCDACFVKLHRSMETHPHGMQRMWQTWKACFCMPRHLIKTCQCGTHLMWGMWFKSTTLFWQDLSSWDVSSVDDHCDVFFCASSFRMELSPPFNDWRHCLDVFQN